MPLNWQSFVDQPLQLAEIGVGILLFIFQFQENDVFGRVQ